MINNVTLVGRLTKQVELRYTPSGAAVSTFTIAVDRAFKNQNGEKETDFINGVAWKHTAEALANYTDKGHRIGLTGRIQTRSYDNNEGKKVFVTEVVAEQITFLEPKNTNTQGTEKKGNTGAKKEDKDPFANNGQIDITDDDLPF